jgi:hypothetical protein
LTERELDLPPAGEALPLSELERFIEHARHAGAVADTPVVAVAGEQDPDLAISLRVEFGRAPGERDNTNELLHLLSEIERNDSDIPAQRRAIHELRRLLTGDAQPDQPAWPAKLNAIEKGFLMRRSTRRAAGRWDESVP